jgi:hypothetical protein
MVAVPFLFMYRPIDIDSAHHRVGQELPKISRPVSMSHADGEDAMVVATAELIKLVSLVEQRKTPDSTM